MAAFLTVAATGLATLSVALAARAGDMKAEMDCVAHSRLLDTHFARFGYAPARSISLEAQGVRIRLPAGTKGVGQTGLYSYVALKGDFEVSATYEWLAVTPPQKGYGVSCGLVVDTEGVGGSVALSRSHLLGRGDGYAVTRGQPGEKGLMFDITHWEATKAKRGRLVLRREGADVICLIANNPYDPPRELGRVAFTTGIVRKVRIVADSGESPTAVDARVSQIRLRAEEIIGGVPLVDSSSAWGWWLAGGALVIAAAVGVLVVRRRQET
jgi:hypothetical protein